VRLRRLAQVLAVLMARWIGSDGLFALCVMAWTFVLVGGLPTIRKLAALLNAAGADVGRGVAWFCSGGLGRSLARMQMRKLDQAEAMAALMIDAAGWKRERWRTRLVIERASYAQGSHGLAQHIAAGRPLAQRCPPGACAFCPGSNWCANEAVLARRWNRQ
jgi:hypothetical protein